MGKCGFCTKDCENDWCPTGDDKMEKKVEEMSAEEITLKAKQLAKDLNKMYSLDMEKLSKIETVAEMRDLVLALISGYNFKVKRTLPEFDKVEKYLKMD